MWSLASVMSLFICPSTCMYIAPPGVGDSGGNQLCPKGAGGIWGYRGGNGPSRGGGPTRWRDRQWPEHHQRLTLSCSGGSRPHTVCRARCSPGRGSALFPMATSRDNFDAVTPVLQVGKQRLRNPTRDSGRQEAMVRLPPWAWALTLGERAVGFLLSSPTVEAASPWRSFCRHRAPFRQSLALAGPPVPGTSREARVMGNIPHRPPAMP